MPDKMTHYFFNLYTFLYKKKKKNTTLINPIKSVLNIF